VSQELEDAAYVWDIWAAAKMIRKLTRDVPDEVYLGDVARRDSIERRLWIIGAAAGRISAAFRRAHPELPWDRWAATPYIVGPAAAEPDKAAIREAVEHDIPQLVERLAPLIPPGPRHGELE
jgi:uncharacterized protein with HEPN domain